MIGAPFSAASLPLHPAAAWRPPGAAPAATAATPTAASCLEGMDSLAGLGTGAAATLHADVPAAWRGQPVQQHAERVLAALLAP